jgi:hypothetical protein
MVVVSAEALTATERERKTKKEEKKWSSDGIVRQQDVNVGGQAVVVVATYIGVQNRKWSCRPGCPPPPKLARVAPSTTLNSAQRADPPRCHPNTWDAVIQQIFDWMAESKDRDAWLMWRNGAAGAGKSAIAQLLTIAERCVAEGLSVASFFFSLMG